MPQHEAGAGDLRPGKDRRLKRRQLQITLKAAFQRRDRFVANVRSDPGRGGEEDRRYDQQQNEGDE